MTLPDRRDDELTGVERAISDVLDDFLIRKCGIISSHSGYDIFLPLLAEAGYKIVPVDAQMFVTVNEPDADW